MALLAGPRRYSLRAARASPASPSPPPPRPRRGPLQKGAGLAAPPPPSSRRRSAELSISSRAVGGAYLLLRVGGVGQPRPSPRPTRLLYPAVPQPPPQTHVLQVTFPLPPSRGWWGRTPPPSQLLGICHLSGPPPPRAHLGCGGKGRGSRGSSLP